MKTLILMCLMTVSASASVTTRPDYVPDENHPINKKVIMLRQAEEEKPKKSRDQWSEEKEDRKMEAKNKIERLP